MTPGQRVGRLRVEKKAEKKRNGLNISVAASRSDESVTRFRLIFVLLLLFFFFLFSFRPQPLTAITDNKIPSTRNDNRQRTENKTIDR